MILMKNTTPNSTPNSTPRRKASLLATAGVVASALCSPFCGGACTRVIYKGLDNLIVVGRSLDWKTPIPTNIYVYPAGIHKQGSDKENAVEWTSRYGAVYAVGYDGGITEGMNEKGLCINALFCKGTVYDNEQTASRPPLSMAMFIGWLLDNNASTDEAVAAFSRHDFSLSGATFDEGTTSTLHWGITDASGKSAIVEFDHGDVKVYDPGDILAMTNDPQWPEMKAILDYWEKIGGTHMLPGTVSSPDRCVRANFFAHNVEAVDDPLLATSICRSILVASCVPYTYTVEGEPNVSSTQWRSYANVRDLTYGFDIVTNYGYFYIDLKSLQLNEGAPVLRLDTSDTLTLVGCANSHLKPSPGFNPMY